MPHLFRAIFAGLTLLACVLVSSQAWADGKPAHRMVAQTFEAARNNGTPLVQVRFSNTVIGTFAIDTGEYESVIADGFAKKAGLNPTSYRRLLFGFGFAPLTFVEVPQVRLENLEMLKPTFRVVSPDFLPPFSGRAIDGIIGGDLLSRFALRIDYPAHEIVWITPGNLSSKEAAELGFTPQTSIELGQERTRSNSKVNHYTIRADFQNGDAAASEDLMIDTGSFDTVVSNALAEELHLRPLATEIMGTLSEPLAPVSRSTIAKMQIGPVVLSNVSVVAPQRTDTGFPSLLGENVLNDCVVLLDFGPHRFYLKPVLPPAKDDSATPLDKKQIVWDRLRAAPDLPTVEQMLGGGFAADAQDALAEQVAHSKLPTTNSTKEADSTKEIERLEKLGALLRQGQDEAGAKAALAQAVVLAKASALAHLEDGIQARQWVTALRLADRSDEAAASAEQTTIRLPRYAPGWQLLGSVLTAKIFSILAGGPEPVTEEKVAKFALQTQEEQFTAAQTGQVEALLVQAHAAFDRAIALDPGEAEGYRDRALFRLVSRIALSIMQQKGLRITLPAAEVPSVETALALAVADWQQWGASCHSSQKDASQKDINTLSVITYLDRALPIFHDRAWLTAHLKETSRTLPSELMTAKTAQARLKSLTQNPDKTLAASAWTALGTAQAGTSDASGSTASGVTLAESCWRQALALDPAQSDALAALALRLKQDGQWQDLTDLLTRQAAVHDTVPTRLTLACVLSGECLPADAETQVRAAKALAPDNAAVDLVLADLLLARSSGDAAALAEASACLAKAKTGYGALATAEQEATLTTSEAVWLALDHDPDAAEKQLTALARKQPNCTQAREALAALISY